MMRQRQYDMRLVSIAVVLFLLLASLTWAVVTRQNLVVGTDTWFEYLLFDIRTPLLLRIFAGITFFGNVFVVGAIAGIVCASLLFSVHRKSYLLGFVSAMLGAGASLLVMKTIIGRPRPSGPIPSVIEHSFSFPSGHATATMALYGFIAFFLCRRYPRSTRVVIATAATIIIATGFSRLYLGVHFSSDIIAGYALGGLWLLTGIALVAWLQRLRA